MTFKQRMNGKKLPIFTLVVFLIGYGALKSQVGTNKEDIQDMKPIPQQISRMGEQVNGLDERIDRFEMRQEKRFDKMDGKMDKLLDAITLGR